MTALDLLVIALLGALSVLVAGYGLRAVSAAGAAPEPELQRPRGVSSVAALALAPGVAGLERQATSLVVLAEASDPPPGWTTRNWAVAEAARTARADWLLITTGDTRWQDGALASLLRFADERRADVVTLFGRQETATLAERLALPVLLLAFAAASPLDVVNDPNRTTVAIAFPECLLIRRSAWEAVGGLRLLAGRDEPWFELARLLKASGRSVVAGSGRALFLAAGGRRWPSLRDRWAHLFRRVIGGRVGLIVTAALVVLGVNVLPFVWLVGGAIGLLLQPGSILWTMCGAIGLAQTAGVLAARRLVDRFTTAPPACALTHPLGGLMVVAILLASLRPRGGGR